MITWDQGVYLSKMHLKIKSREISFAHKLLTICQFILKLCTEHGSITAVLYSNFQNDLTIETDLQAERGFARLEFRENRLSYVALDEQINQIIRNCVKKHIWWFQVTSLILANRRDFIKYIKTEM